MAIQSFKSLVDAELNGQSFIGGFRKNITASTGVGTWFDVSLSPGNPLPFYYASNPLVGVPMKQSTDGGIPHNLPVGQLGHKTYLKTITISPTSTTAFCGGPMILMDYLYYYPFVDSGTTDEQLLDNSTPMTRYTDGKGVSVMAVQIAGMSGVGNATFRFTYLNQNGELKTSPPQTCGSSSVVGQLATTNNSASAILNTNNPFLSLAAGDYGIQSIQSVTFDAPDIGLLAFVLVKPLEHIVVREIGTAAERTPAVDFLDLPIIADDAYLSMLVNTGPNSATSANFIGTIQTTWG